MSKIDSSYAASYYNEPVQKAQKNAGEVKNQKTRAASADKAGQPRLSDAAQKLLEKLQKKYSNMDFMVTSSSNAMDAKGMLSNSNKEYSVLFSAEELEKMASDEKYEHEYMAKVQGAIQMTNKIAQQGGFGAASGSDLTSVGVSISGDGTKTFFAELEKSSEQQRERIDEAREKRAAEKKAAEKKAAEKKEPASKKVTIQAAYQMELIDKLNAFDWKKA